METPHLNQQKECCKKPKTAILLVGMVLLAAVLIVAVIRDRIVNQMNWQISVTGQGKVYYEPDRARVTFGVQVDKAQTAEKALKDLNGTMGRVIQAIQKAGIAKEYIQTQTYYLAPHYDYAEAVISPSLPSNQKITGYDANEQLAVTISAIDKNIDLIGRVIASATQAGVNQVQNIIFDSSKIDDLKHEARLKAIADAQNRSKDLSSALGVKFGKIVGWWENIVFVPTPYSGMEYGKGDFGGGGGGGPMVPSGTNEVNIEVSLNYLVD